MKVYKICFYVPTKEAGRVKQALFSAGAGRIGNYDSCAWQTEGTGQFRGNESSNPAVGERGSIHYEPEAKVELVCEEPCLRRAIEALIEAHPYEEPAWQVWPVMTELSELP